MSSGESPFFKLSLTDLRNVFERNSLSPNGRRNWRKSFVNAIEDLEHEELVLEQDEYDQIFNESTDDENSITSTVEKYRISLSGKKRKRSESFEEFEEDVIVEEPVMKKRKVEEVDDDVMVTIFQKLYNMYHENEILDFMNEEGDYHEKMNDCVEMLKEKSYTSNRRKLLFIIQYYRHLVPDWNRLFNGVDQTRNSSVDLFFQNEITARYQKTSENFFISALTDGIEEGSEEATEIEDKVRDEVGQRIKNGMKDHVGGLVDGIVDEYYPAPKITVRIVNSDGVEFIFRMSRTTKFRHLMDSYNKRAGVRPGVIRFLYDGNNLNPYATPNEYDMEEEDTIDAMVEQTGGKPVILLYSPVDNFEVKKVKVELNPRFWSLRCHYPDKISSDLEMLQQQQQLIPPPPPPQEQQKQIAEWNDILVKQNGEISFKKQNTIPRKVEYLFWESSNSNTFDFIEGEGTYPIFLLNTEHITTFLFHHLSSMGLPEKETNNFICFWLMALKSNKYALIQFVKQSEYEKWVRLEVTPQPDVVSKIFMLFVTFDSPDNIVVEKRSLIERNLKKVAYEKVLPIGDKFVAVEWGGMDLVTSKWIKI